MAAQNPSGCFPMCVAGIDRRKRFGSGRFRSPVFKGKFTISGVTKNSSGSALGNCVVLLFDASTNIELLTTISDASGNYSFPLGNNTNHYFIVAYLAGSPDVAGTTVNTLTVTVS